MPSTNDTRVASYQPLIAPEDLLSELPLSPESNTLVENARAQIKRVVQMFLDEIVEELGRGNRLEFRDFGVFESRMRKARRAQNPRTLEPVRVPSKRTVKFKVGRLMKARLDRSVPEEAEHSASGREG